MDVATEVRFIKILGEPVNKSIIINSIELADIIKGIEREMQSRGFIIRSLGYSWNTLGTNQAFIFNELKNGKHLIATFETRSVRSN
jgi:hypothetical protein